MHIYIEIMLGLTIGVGAFASLAIIDKYKKQSRVAQLYNFRLLAKDILDEAIKETGVTNAIFGHVHNSGGEILVGKNLYSSILEESTSKVGVDSKSDWQKMPISEVFFKTMKDLNFLKKLSPNIEEMDECTLKRVYQKNNTKYTLFFETYAQSNLDYYFVEFRYNDYLKAIEGHEFVKLELIANKLSKLCNNARWKGILK